MFSGEVKLSLPLVPDLNLEEEEVWGGGGGRGREREKRKKNERSFSPVLVVP